MANEELAQTLERLQQQLSQSPQLDPATSESLQALLLEIQRVCAAPETPAPAADVPQRSLSEQLQKVIEDFEFRHPQMTKTLSQIADTLSEMGI